MKKRIVFHITLAMAVLLTFNGCKTNEEARVTDESSQTKKETVVYRADDFERLVQNCIDEEQSFVLREDVSLDVDEISFKGTNITVEGVDERVRISMSSTGGFNFKGFMYPGEIKESSSITIKNIDFINEKSASGPRNNCYIYSYAEDVTYENCTFEGGVLVSGNAKFINCTFSETDSLRLCIFIDNEHGQRKEGMNIELRNCTFDGNNTAYGLVRMADEYDLGAKLKVENCQFKNISNKAAVYVSGYTDITTEGTNSYSNCSVGAILARGDNCTINGETMIAGTSYEQ